MFRVSGYDGETRASRRNSHPTFLKKSTMTPSTLTQTLLGSLLDSPAIVEVASQAGGSVISVLREHFTFTASEITKAYQEGCGYAFVAISVGLDAPQQ